MQTNNHPEIRLAKKEDVPAIYTMMTEIAKATGCEHKVESTITDLERDGFGNNPAFGAMIAYDGSIPVAMCVFFPSYSTFRGARGLYLLDLYVAPELRGDGFAKHLLAQVAKYAQAQGLTYFRLAVDTDNMLAQAFYDKLDMRHAEDERIFILDGEAFRALASEG